MTTISGITSGGNAGATTAAGGITLGAAAGTIY